MISLYIDNQYVITGTCNDLCIVVITLYRDSKHIFTVKMVHHEFVFALGNNFKMAGQIFEAKIRSHKSFLEELAAQLAASQPPKKKKRNSTAANAPAAKERKRRPQVSDQYLLRTKTVRSGDNHQISDTPDKQKADKAKCCWCRYLKLPPKDVMTAKISCDKCDSLLFCSAKHFNDFHKA